MWLSVGPWLGGPVAGWFGETLAGLGCGFLGHSTLLDQRQWESGWCLGSGSPMVDQGTRETAKDRDGHLGRGAGLGPRESHAHTAVLVTALACAGSTAAGAAAGPPRPLASGTPRGPGDPHCMRQSSSCWDLEGLLEFGSQTVFFVNFVNQITHFFPSKKAKINK